MASEKLFAINGDVLSSTEAANFQNLLAFMKQKEACEEILFLYRGEKSDQLARRLARTSIQYEELLRRLFYFGEKGRHFHEPQIKIRERAFLRTINDTSPATILFIFDRIANVLASPVPRKSGRDPIPQEFRQFFSGRENRNLFVERFSAIESVDARLAARDYYLYFLHVAGSSGIRAEAMLVSATTRKGVAVSFAKKNFFWGRKGKSMPRKGVVFHYFVPRPFHSHAIGPWKVTHHQELVRTRNLPTFEPTGLYPRQHEVALKGALFPQMILGMEILEDRDSHYIPNPHALNLTDSDFEEVGCSGIPVDQRAFDENIFHTAYDRWVERNENGNYFEFDCLPD